MRAAAQRQRVQTEEDGTPEKVPASKDGVPQRVPTSQEDAPQRVSPEEDEADNGAVLMPGLEVTCPSLKEQKARPNVVSQDLDGPSQITRAALRQRLLTVAEENNSYPATSKAASRQYPLKFLVDLAAAVLDE